MVKTKKKEHSNEETDPLVRNFSPLHSSFKNLDVSAVRKNSKSRKEAVLYAASKMGLGSLLAPQISSGGASKSAQINKKVLEHKKVSKM